MENNFRKNFKSGPNYNDITEAVSKPGWFRNSLNYQRIKIKKEPLFKAAL